jgi:glycerophosphoryl diester phosphodiesterase
MLPRLMLSLALASLACFAPPPAAAQCDCPAETVRIIGHRGAGSDDASEAFPENTVESARQAFTEGADMVEVDVQLTADGEVVLMHDDTVDRTTDGTGCVSALTAAEIAALDADGVPVPTLEGFLAAVDGDVNVEIKLHEGDACPAQDPDALADAVVATLRAATGDREVLVSSFDLDVLRRVRSAAPSIPIGYLSSSAADVDVAAAEGFEAIHLLSAVANVRTVRRAHDAGLAVNVWTVDGEDDVRGVLDVGVDGVITDTVEAAVAARAGWCEGYVCPGADAGAAGADAGSTAMDAAGCRAAPGPSGAPGWWAAAGALALWLRRRRRARRSGGGKPPVAPPAGGRGWIHGRPRAPTHREDRPPRPLRAQHRAGPSHPARGHRLVQPRRRGRDGEPRPQPRHLLRADRLLARAPRELPAAAVAAAGAPRAAGGGRALES